MNDHVTKVLELFIPTENKKKKTELGTNNYLL